MKETHLYKKLINSVKSKTNVAKPQFNKVKCQNCAHNCIISAVPPGRRGICGVRENQNGKLYALNYGKACALHIDPIEKKPLFHFLPGSQSLSMATVGCNFKCSSCHNYNISQMPQLTGKIQGQDISPTEIVRIALKNKLPSISYTYTEPAIFSEYALETMKIARKKGLKNNWVSNGFWSKELFSLIYPYLDAVNIDLKSFENEFYIKYCGGRLQPVLDTLIRLKEKKIWIEVTTLIIPTLNDADKIFKNIAKFIKEKLDPETPWHISRFSGAISWRLKNLPDTPIETLERAYKIGKKIGLKYVYTGNVPGLASENTYCPKCETLAINRIGYFIKRYDKNGQCSKCGQDLSIIE